MLIPAWNCWGLGNPPIIRTLKSLLRGTSLSTPFLSETKMSENISIFAQFGFQNYYIIPSVGRSGGLWLLWKEEIQIEIISKSSNYIHVVVNHVGSTNSCHLSAFMAHQLLLRELGFGKI